MSATINRVFPHLRRPILPGFNFFVDAAVYHEADEFSNLPNEDTALSRQLSGYGDVAYHPEALVETASRRITESGLTGTLFHYVALDLERIRGTN